MTLNCHIMINESVPTFLSKHAACLHTQIFLAADVCTQDRPHILTRTNCTLVCVCVCVFPSMCAHVQVVLCVEEVTQLSSNSCALCVWVISPTYIQISDQGSSLFGDRKVCVQSATNTHTHTHSVSALMPTTKLWMYSAINSVPRAETDKCQWLHHPVFLLSCNIALVLNRCNNKLLA